MSFIINSQYKWKVNLFMFSTVDKATPAKILIFNSSHSSQWLSRSNLTQITHVQATKHYLVSNQNDNKTNNIRAFSLQEHFENLQANIVNKNLFLMFLPNEMYKNNIIQIIYCISTESVMAPHSLGPVEPIVFSGSLHTTCLCCFYPLELL